MSCAGNGYLSGNELVPFPFEDGKSLAWEGSVADADAAQIALEKCFVDAGVAFSSNPSEEDAWPSVGDFGVSGNVLRFVLRFGGTETRLSVSSSGAKFPIVDGRTDAGSYVLVLSSEGIRDFISFCSSSGVSPPSSGSSSPSGMDGDCYLRLCAKCVTFAPEPLSSIRVFDGVGKKEDGPHFVLSGSVEIRPGNNMRLSEPEDEDNGISLDAVPGAGMGKIACSCSGSGGALAALTGPDGHLRIFNDTCYDVEPCEKEEIEVDGETRTSRVLRLHAKCIACCQCSMYESIVNDRLVGLANAIRKIKSDLDKLRLGDSGYEKSVSKFNGRIAKPSLKDVRLTLSGMPVGADVGQKLEDTLVSGKMERCAFSAFLSNGSFSTIEAKLSGLSATDTILQATVVEVTKKGDAVSTSYNRTSVGSLVGKKYDVRPGSYLVVNFIAARDELVKQIRRKPFVGAISFSLSYFNESGARRGLGTVSRSISAEGDRNEDH